MTSREYMAIEAKEEFFEKTLEEYESMRVTSPSSCCFYCCSI